MDARTRQAVVNRLRDSIAAIETRHPPPRPALENDMSLGTILLIILILILVGALPSWPHSRSWGYAPSGILGVVLVVVLILLLTGRL